MDPINSTMKALIENMPREDQQGNMQQHCTQFFDLLCALIDQSEEADDQGGHGQFVVDFDQLMESTVTAIKNHKSTETRIHTKNDKVLIGLLNLSARLLVIRPQLREAVGKENFVMEVFGKCLFDVTPNEELIDVDILEYDKVNNKCKSEETRNAAYSLLFAICRNSPKNMGILIE